MLTWCADDETDLEQLKANVLAIQQDGLVWGASKFVAVGFGIKKLQINLVVEDEKVSTDELQQKIEEDEDHVQSTDIVSTARCSSPCSVPLTSRPGCHAKVVGPCLLSFLPSSWHCSMTALMNITDWGMVYGRHVVCAAAR